MADKRLEELSADLAAATEERDKAQAVANAAQSRVREASQALRNHLKSAYSVDPWRL